MPLLGSDSREMIGTKGESDAGQIRESPELNPKQTAS